MADHSIAADAVGVHNITLTPDTVDVFTFAKDPDSVEILSDGTAAVYVTVDGTAPTVGGSHTWKLPAVACSRRITHSRPTGVVKVISAGAAVLSVTRA